MPVSSANKRPSYLASYIHGLRQVFNQPNSEADKLSKVHVYILAACKTIMFFSGYAVKPAQIPSSPLHPWSNSSALPPLSSDPAANSRLCNPANVHVRRLKLLVPIPSRRVAETSNRLETFSYQLVRLTRRGCLELCIHNYYIVGYHAASPAALGGGGRAVTLNSIHWASSPCTRLITRPRYNQPTLHLRIPSQLKTGHWCLQWVFCKP